MRLNKKSIVGRVDQSGALIAPMKVLEDFFSMHQGKAVIVRAEILPTEPSDKVRGYFFGYLIPELQGILLTEYGERMTKEQAYLWIRQQCPLFVKEERRDGKFTRALKEFEDLDPAEANEVIEWTIQYCAENFYTILDYPK